MTDEEATTHDHAAAELAAKLQLPPAGLPALRQLTPDQAALLSDLIEAARARRRAELEAALRRAVPPKLARRALLALLRRPAA